MDKSMLDLMRQRYSCRRYLEKPIGEADRDRLDAFLAAHHTGPFGSRHRFAFVAATADDPASLKGLGTYGFIKNARGFIVGAMSPAPRAPEDFGYLMEHAILHATGLGLGTCWLGGSYTKSSFARKIAATPAETVPAVTSVGYPAEAAKDDDWIRRRAGGAFRLPPEQLFFAGAFGRPLDLNAIGAYAEVLEMVRWAPSASNKQPWRVVMADGRCHLYLQRTKGYGKDSFFGRLLGVADLQRVDLGIAMCHFELAARALGLAGRWELAEPSVARPDSLTEYTVTWVPG